LEPITWPKPCLATVACLGSGDCRAVSRLADSREVSVPACTLELPPRRRTGPGGLIGLGGTEKLHAESASGRAPDGRAI
jgi:hypothetical protein